MKSICLDTKVLSNFLSKKEKAKRIIEKYQKEGYEIYTTTINVSEYFMGLFKVKEPTDDELAKLKDFFHTLGPINLNYECALLAGKLFSQTLKDKKIGWRDTYIASIVLNNGNVIITSNLEHFKRIPNLNVVEY